MNIIYPETIQITKSKVFTYDVRLDVVYQCRDNVPISHIQQNIFENYRRDISSVTVNKIHSKYLDKGDVRDFQRNRLQKNSLYVMKKNL